MVNLPQCETMGITGCITIDFSLAIYNVGFLPRSPTQSIVPRSRNLEPAMVDNVALQAMPKFVGWHAATKGPEIFLYP